MVTATAQNMQRFDTVGLQKTGNCLFYWHLRRENALWIEERLCGLVEVNILDIEICDERFAVPKRAADFESVVQKRVERVGPKRLEWRQRGFIAAGEKFARELAIACRSEKFTDPRAYIGLPIVTPPFFNRIHSATTL